MPCPSCRRPMGPDTPCSTCVTAAKEIKEILRVSGKVTVQYFERDVFVGERLAHSSSMAYGGGHYSSYWPNTAYFCPTCGDLWAREIYQFHFDYEPLPKSSWVVEIRRCVRCGDGTFLAGQDIDKIENEALLRRELAALIYNFERNQNASNLS